MADRRAAAPADDDVPRDLDALTRVLRRRLRQIEEAGEAAAAHDRPRRRPRRTASASN